MGKQTKMIHTEVKTVLPSSLRILLPHIVSQIHREPLLSYFILPASVLFEEKPNYS